MDDRHDLTPLPKPVSVKPAKPAGDRVRPPAERTRPQAEPERFNDPPPSSGDPGEPTWADAFQVLIKRVKRGLAPYLKRLQHTRLMRLSGVLALGIVFVLLIVSIIWSGTNKNALAVYLGDTLVGNIVRVKDLDEAELQREAVDMLEAQLKGAVVQVNETLSVKPVHSAAKNIKSRSEVLDEATRLFTYQIAAAAIYVNGTEIAVLRTIAEAEEVARQLQMPYLVGNYEDYISISFVEDWEIVIKNTDEEDLDRTEDALTQLDKRTRGMDDYAIQGGDNLYVIARKFNTTINKICTDNPGYTTDTILRAGSILKIETTKPFLSVKTIEETTRAEVIPFSVKNVDNNEETVSYTNVRQEGTNGEREIASRITRINGQQVTEEEIETRVIREPIDRIVEVGTLETTAQRR